MAGLFAEGASSEPDTTGEEGRVLNVIALL